MAFSPESNKFFHRNLLQNRSHVIIFPESANDLCRKIINTYHVISTIYALILAEIAAVRCSNFGKVHAVILNIDIITKII